MTEKKIALVKNESIGKLAYEMGLNKWYIISNHAEEKKTRTNLKKLGCLFEAFLGALFLDYNKLEIRDEEEWFKNVFVTGPGWQMAQKFVENVFESHVDWIELINNDDNYKNILQVKIQKNSKQHLITLKFRMTLKLDIIWECIYVWVNKFMKLIMKMHYHIHNLEILKKFKNISRKTKKFLFF